MDIAEGKDPAAESEIITECKKIGRPWDREKLKECMKGYFDKNGDCKLSSVSLLKEARQRAKEIRTLLRLDENQQSRAV